MKKTIILISVLILLLLSACADASVAYNLSDDNKAKLEYTLVIKSIELDARNYAESISEYWHAQGFDAKTDLGTDNMTVSGKKAISSDSRQAAADAFGQMLSDQSSVFSDVEFSYKPAFEDDIYNLSARVSLVDIIRQSEVQDIPSSELEALITQAKTGVYALSVSLPGEISDTNADETDGNVCRWILEYGKETQISLQTHLENTQAVSEYNDVTQKLSTAGMLLWVLEGAAGLIVLIIIILLIVRSVKKHRN